MMANCRGWGFSSGGATGSRENQRMAEAEARRALEIEPYRLERHSQMLSWWAFTFYGELSGGVGASGAGTRDTLLMTFLLGWPKGVLWCFQAGRVRGAWRIQTALRLSPRDPCFVGRIDVVSHKSLSGEGRLWQRADW